MADDDNEIEQDEDDAPEFDNEIEQETGVFRWMSVVVVMLAIAGFLGLAWYAYKSGGEVINEKDAELITADATPVKEPPANPGGMTIPNQDKTVYGLVGGKQDEGKVVEHILAPPETPVARTDDSDTSTWMSDQVKEKLKTSGGEALPPAPPSPKDTAEKISEPKEVKPEPKAEEPAAGKAEQFQPAKLREAKGNTEIKELKLSGTEQKPAEKPPVTEAAKPAPKPEARQEEPEETTAAEEPAEKKPIIAEQKKPAPAEEKKAASAAPPSGSRAQLGAFKTEAEADGQWKKISRKFASDVQGKDHYIVRADLGSKGIYYRLQLAPFASSGEVDKFCLSLVSEGQGCFPLKANSVTVQSAAIFGLKGHALSEEEKRFFTRVNPLGFILFARNCDTPDQLRALTASLKSLLGRDLPMLIDQEGGRVARLKPPHWRKAPAAKLFADYASSTSQQEAAEAIYANTRFIARELHELGINVDCAPLADVPVIDAHDIIGDRAFGTEPGQVAFLAGAMAKGLTDGGVLPVLKHIPGHGRARADSHEELPTVHESLEVLRKTDFIPFKALRHLPMGMTAHILYTAIDPHLPATLSPRVMDIIRNEIGFDGLPMSDDLSMKALGGSFGERTKLSLQAGCDIVLHCNGEMAEMEAIAGELSPLSSVAQSRFARAWAQLTPPISFDYAAAETLLAAV